MKKGMIVVTGGAGFIGSALIRELNRSGREEIVVVDSLGSGDKWRNLNGLRFADYLDKEDFLQQVRAGNFGPPPEAIFHLGACSSTTELDVGYLMRNNFEYSKSLARYCLNSSVRLIYASSAATYGDGGIGFKDSEDDLPRLRPLNPYGFSKQLFDLWAWRAGALGKIVGLKYFNVFGPNEYHKGEMRSMVCKGYEQIRSAGRLKLFKSERPEFGDGEQERDFLYVKDAARMTLFFLSRPEARGIFNIGSGEVHTWNQLAGALFRAAGLPPAIEYIPLPDRLRDRYQYHTRAEIAKLRSAGYSAPPTPLAEAVEDYVRNYLDGRRHLGEVANEEG